MRAPAPLWMRVFERAPLSELRLAPPSEPALVVVLEPASAAVLPVAASE